MDTKTNACNYFFPVGNHRCFNMFWFLDWSFGWTIFVGLVIFSAKDILWVEAVHELLEPMTTTLWVIWHQILATILYTFNCSPCCETVMLLHLLYSLSCGLHQESLLHLKYFMCLWSLVTAIYLSRPMGSAKHFKAQHQTTAKGIWFHEEQGSQNIPPLHV